MTDSLGVLAAIATTQIKRKRQQKGKKQQLLKKPAFAVSAGGADEGETSSSDDRVVVLTVGHQEMVEESRKRKASQQQRALDDPAAALTGAAGGDGSRQDAFAAFASQYRDMLRFADADEAEAVYSMVALTQARAPQWAAPQPGADAAAAGQGRPAKRQQVAARSPAAPACSEGGSSDSSAKSAPSPNLAAQQQPQQQGVVTGPYMPSGMMVGQPGSQPGAQAQQRSPSGPPAADLTPAAAGGNMCMPRSMPMGPGFFPPGMMGMPGAPGCPMPPFLPPWAMPPGMMPMMFGTMGMFGPVPPGSPPLMPMPPPGVPIPGMPSMPPAFMPGLPMVSGPMLGPGGMSQPAAGIPISAPTSAAMPGAPGSVKAGTSAAAGPAAAATGQRASCQSKQQQQATAVGAPASLTGRPANSSKAAAANNSPPAAAAKGISVHQLLDQLDVVGLKPWVVSHFCEDVYLLLLDVWRPDSAKVRDAIWAWKLHIKGPRQGNSPPDYRAFLVSLFGLEKLLQLTAADRAAKGGSSTSAPSSLPTPAPFQAVKKDPGIAAAVAATADAAGSGNSSAADTAVPSSDVRRLGVAVPTGVVVGSATSPAVAGITVQPQPA